MQELALASDAQLRNIAQQKARREYATSPNRKTESNFALALPVMDSFLVGATAKGGIKNKVLAGGNQLKDWGIFLFVTHLYHKAINKIVDKSETLQDFRENSPFMFGVANTALGVTAGISGIHYINKGYNKFISPLIPQKLKDGVKNLVNSTDKSSFVKAVNGNMKDFATKYPKITKTLNTAARWALPLLCLGFMGAMAIDAIKAKMNENRTYKQLSDARLAAAQELALKNQ